MLRKTEILLRCMLLLSEQGDGSTGDVQLLPSESCSWVTVDFHLSRTILAPKMEQTSARDPEKCD